MKYKAIALDLDGTLLDSHRTVSKKNKEAVERAAQKGIRIIICSGRIFPEAYNYVKDISGITEIAACNGAVIKDIKTMQVIFENAIEPDIFFDLTNALYKSHLFFNVYFGDKTYIENKTFEKIDFHGQHIEGLQCDSIKFEDISEAVKSKRIRPDKIIAVNMDIDYIKKVRIEFEKRNDVEITSSNWNNIEITNKGVDKRRALEFICRKYGISKEEIIAMGDGDNDLPMLRYAGTPVVMGNAADSIKQVAGFVTETNDNDGVALAIEKYIL